MMGREIMERVSAAVEANIIPDYAAPCSTSAAAKRPGWRS